MFLMGYLFDYLPPCYSLSQKYGVCFRYPTLHVSHPPPYSSSSRVPLLFTSRYSSLFNIWSGGEEATLILPPQDCHL